MRSVLLTLVALAGVAGLLVALAVALCVRQHARQRDKERLAALGPEGAHGDTTFEYQVCGPRSLLMRGDLGVWVSHGVRVGCWMGSEHPSLGIPRLGLQKPRQGCCRDIVNGGELGADAS